MNFSETQKKFLKAFRKNRGHISGAAEAAGVVRQSYYYWVNNNKDFADKIDEIREAHGDEIEEVLFRVGLGLIKTNRTVTVKDGAGNITTITETETEHPPNIKALELALKARYGDRGYMVEDIEKIVKVIFEKEITKLNNNVKKP